MLVIPTMRAPLDLQYLQRKHLVVVLVNFQHISSYLCCGMINTEIHKWITWVLQEYQQFLPTGWWRSRHRPWEWKNQNLNDHRKFLYPPEGQTLQNFDSEWQKLFSKDIKAQKKAQKPCHFTSSEKKPVKKPKTFCFGFWSFYFVRVPFSLYCGWKYDFFWLFWFFFNGKCVFFNLFCVFEWIWSSFPIFGSKIFLSYFVFVSIEVTHSFRVSFWALFWWEQMTTHRVTSFSNLS